MSEPIFIKCNAFLSKVDQERFMYDIKKKLSDQPVILLPPYMDVVHPVQRWIPVTERLPEKSGAYLVTILNRELGPHTDHGHDVIQGAKPPEDEYWDQHANLYAERADGKWVHMVQRIFDAELCIWGGYGEIQLAWMPLPEPWKEER